MDDANYGGKSARKPLFFNELQPPYFFSAVMSFGEYGAERAEIRARRCFRSQELFANKPADTGDFRRSEIAERDLP